VAASAVQQPSRPPTRYAVLRFTGLPADDTVAAKTAEVEHLLKAKNLAAAGPPLVAQYNPPAADASLYAPRRDRPRCRRASKPVVSPPN
jgi:hypothetical protein